MRLECVCLYFHTNSLRPHTSHAQPNGDILTLNEPNEKTNNKNKLNKLYEPTIFYLFKVLYIIESETKNCVKVNKRLLE